MIDVGSTIIGSALLGTGHLTIGMQITCWVLGALSLVVNLGLKKIPLDYFKLERMPDLESDSKDDKV